jgi:hypothetical protein
MNASCVSIDSACPLLEPEATGGVEQEEGNALEQVLDRRITQRTWGRLQFRVWLGAGRVIIQGRSPTYYLKQLALAAVREVLPTAPVELQIRVVKTGALSGPCHQRTVLAP